MGWKRPLDIRVLPFCGEIAPDLLFRFPSVCIVSHDFGTSRGHFADKRGTPLLTERVLCDRLVDARVASLASSRIDLFDALWPNCYVESDSYRK